MFHLLRSKSGRYDPGRVPAIWSESIFLFAQLECLFTALSDQRDLVFDSGTVDCTNGLDLPAGLVTRLHIVATNNEFRIPVHNEIGIVAGKDKLPPSLRGPHFADNLWAGWLSSTVRSAVAC